MHLYSTGIVHHCWTIQLFTYLAMDSAMCPCLHFAKRSISHILGTGTPNNGAYDPEIQTQSRFLYNAPTHKVSSSYD